jgi:hypothetical protein
MTLDQRHLLSEIIGRPRYRHGSQRPGQVKGHLRQV